MVTGWLTGSAILLAFQDAALTIGFALIRAMRPFVIALRAADRRCCVLVAARSLAALIAATKGLRWIAAQLDPWPK